VLHYDIRPAALRETVYLQPGTVRDEHAMKRNGTCPKCGEPLAASVAAGHDS
jgi:ribosomal protein S27AE